MSINAEKSVIDGVIENVVRVLPFMFKKLVKLDFESVNKNIAYIHFAIMKVLGESGALPISEIGKRLVVAKPQMTHLIDELISLDIVVRMPDTRDRRIINIGLTVTGRDTLDKCRQLLRDNVRSKLSYLNEDELKELAALLNRLADIGARLK